MEPNGTMDSGNIIECRGCGRRHALHLAAHQMELAQVGMLEQHCFGCARISLWQLVAARRRDERRRDERRRLERRQYLMQAPLLGRERRGGKERRLGPIRKVERRMSQPGA
jgi:hypothetical protein